MNRWWTLVLAAYPPSWRRDREDEVLDLLDERRPRGLAVVSESASLAVGGLRARGDAASRSLGATVAGGVRAAASIVLLLNLALVCVRVIDHEPFVPTLTLWWVGYGAASVASAALLLIGRPKLAGAASTVLVALLLADRAGLAEWTATIDGWSFRSQQWNQAAGTYADVPQLQVHWVASLALAAGALLALGRRTMVDRREAAVRLATGAGVVLLGATIALAVGNLLRWPVPAMWVVVLVLAGALWSLDLRVAICAAVLPAFLLPAYTRYLQDDRALNTKNVTQALFIVSVGLVLGVVAAVHARRATVVRR
jgi:hypothetical protein